MTGETESRARVPVLANASGERLELDAGRTSPEEEARLAAGFGAIVRAERRRAGFTLRGMARALGISKSYLSDLERGKRRPRHQTAEVLAGFLGEMLEVDRHALAARLKDAAGESLRPDTERSRTAWARRGRDAVARGHRPLPPAVVRSIDAARRGEGPPVALVFADRVLRVGYGPDLDGWASKATINGSRPT